MSIVNKILDLKRQEAELKARRETLEAELTKQFEIDLGKSKTQKIEGVSVTLKSPIYYKIEIKDKIPKKLRPVKLMRRINNEKNNPRAQRNRMGRTLDCVGNNLLMRKRNYDKHNKP